MEIKYLLCADWGMNSRKRRCCLVDVDEASFVILDEHSLSLERLLEIGMSISKQGPTLLSLDLAIGVPELFHLAIHEENPADAPSFLRWLATKNPEADFWNEVSKAEDWTIDRPFISVPKGKGSLKKFQSMAGQDLKRRADRKYGGKSPFIVNGIPGTVGSGTRSFWRELAPRLRENRPFAIWPFDADLKSLFQEHRLVIAENYPAVCYTAVFADHLPSPQLILSKTHRNVREAALARLSKLSWITEYSAILPDLTGCIQSEDDFDALMTALAQFRLIRAGLGIVDEASADRVAEGGILCTNAIQPEIKSKSLDAILGARPPAKNNTKVRQIGAQRIYVCPLCNHTFKQARGGWRPHVSSINRHPDWHPEITSGEQRQKLFENEFPGFFE